MPLKDKEKRNEATQRRGQYIRDAEWMERNGYNISPDEVKERIAMVKAVLGA